MKILERALQDLVALSARSPRVVALCALVLTMGLGVFAARLPEAISIRDQLDSSRPETRALDAYRAEFRDDGSFGFLLDTSKLDLQSVCAFETRLSNLVLDVTPIRSHVSPLRFQRVVHDGEKYSIESTLDACAGAKSDSHLKIDGFVPAGLTKLFMGNDGKSWLYLFQLQSTPDNLSVATWLPALQEKIEALAPGARIDWFGAPVQELHMHRGAKTIQILNGAIVVLVLVLFWWFFGTWTSGLVFWSTMSVTLALVYGGFALSGGKQDLVFLSLFMILTVASLEDFIFVAFAQPGEQATLQNFKSVALPSFLTSFTTSVGFGSLLMSDLQPVRLFGVWAAVGATVEWIVVFTVLPAVLQLWPRAGCWTKNRHAEKETRALAFRFSPWLGLASFLVFLFPLADRAGFLVTQSPAHVFPQSHPVSRAFDELERTRGWVGNVDLVFDASMKDETKRAIVNRISKADHVRAVDDAESLFSAMTSTIVDADLHDFIHGQLSTLPASRRYFADSGRERAWLFLDTLDINRVLDLQEKIKTSCPEGDCSLEGEFIAFSTYSKSIVQTLFSSFLVSLFLVGVILAACTKARGRLRDLPAILISSFWAPFAILFVIWIAKIEVNFVTSVVLSVLVGLTGDNAIQFLFASGDLDEGARSKGRASFVCSVSMTLVSISFFFAPFEPTKLLGALMASGFALVFIGDYSLLRGLLKLRRK